MEPRTFVGEAAAVNLVIIAKGDGDEGQRVVVLRIELKRVNVAFGKADAPSVDQIYGIVHMPKNWSVE